MLLPQAVPGKKGGEKRRGDDRGGGDASLSATANPGYNKIVEDPLDKLQLSGACDSLSILNTEFIKQGVTADNKPYYQSKDGSYYLYYDKDCNGAGWYPNPPSWILEAFPDGSKPSTTAASDLDGDGKCNFDGRVTSTDAVPPPRAEWQLSCNDTPTLQSVTLTIDWYAGWHVCPPGSFCKGDGCPSNNAALAVPRDRWDPDMVRVMRFLCRALLVVQEK